MKKILVFIILIAGLQAAFAQQKSLSQIADSIVTEGKTLYKSEWASWYGEDIFKEKCPGKVSLLGGYLSYDTGKGINNILLSKGENPTVFATVSFSYGFDKNSYKIDTISRKLNAAELELFDIRLKTLKHITTDTLFKSYKNTSLNPVPIIENGVKKVYVLTGTSLHGLVVLGNDYLVTFDKKNEIESVTRLHKNIIAIQMQAGDKTIVGGMHTHLPQTGEFITATDICTLMLYEKFTTWNNHYVLGKNYVSVWDCKRNELSILTRAEWEKQNTLKNSLDNTGKQ